MGIGKSKKKKERSIPKASSEQEEPVVVSDIKQSGGNVELYQENPEIRVLDLSVSGTIKTRQSSDLSSPKKLD